MADKPVAACIQMCSRDDVESNLAQAGEAIRTAASAGAELILLPEAFAYLGPEEGKRKILEPLPEGGAILDRCRTLARQARVHLVLGGFHEAAPAPDTGKGYNTAVHLDPEGEIRAMYRKIHLFDVSLANAVQLQESSRTLAGDHPVVTDTPCGRLGLSICYDLRFPGLYARLVAMGAELLAAPSAFTSITGAAHWHILLQARAIETQCYMLAPAQSGFHHGKRTSYGHSLVADPWGRILSEHATGPGVIHAAIDLAELHRIRRELPALPRFLARTPAPPAHKAVPEHPSARFAKDLS